MKIIQRLLDIIFPSDCTGCGERPAEKYSLCSECRKKYISEGFEKCTVCGENVMKCICSNDYIPHASTLIGGYSYCILTFYKSFSGFGHSERITEKMIYALKERGEYADLFADEMTRELERLFRRADEDISEWIITYPPRSAVKFKRYGFDQCELVVKQVSKKLGIPYVRVFERTDGEEQKSLGAQDRAVNADSTLRIRKDLVKQGGKYIVFDDIITTGSTISTAARHLYFCGASAVFPAAIAKSMTKEKIKGDSYDKRNA